uniref:BTB/POZ domain-containing protein n=1 Tax=Gongylonema pulchrum TaxID=637853 RepID=A0A183D7K0_9BILA
LGLFMASVVIDYLVMEPAVVDAVITKLALDRKYEMLVDLLKYCAMHTNLSFIRGIELKWSHAARWLFSLIESGTADEKQQFCRFLLFCLWLVHSPILLSLCKQIFFVGNKFVAISSCPKEYGRSLGEIVHSLDQKKFPVVHRLLLLASCAVIVSSIKLFIFIIL